MRRLFKGPPGPLPPASPVPPASGRPAPLPRRHAKALFRFLQTDPSLFRAHLREFEGLDASAAEQQASEIEDELLRMMEVF